MAARRQRGGLWRQRDFRLLWVGETTSGFGNSVTTVALPLVAVTTLHASTFTLGVLSASVWLPWLVVGLPAGAWVDRLPRRNLMLACDVGSALVLATVPLAAWWGVLTVAQLLVVALLGGGASVLFSTAYGAYLPSLVSADDLVDANMLLSGSSSAAKVAGPGIGGLLAQLAGAAVGLLADALTFVVSAGCLLRIRGRESVPRHGANVVSGIGAGLRLVAGDPYLRVLAGYSAIANFALMGSQTLEVVFLVRVVGVSSATVGLLLAMVGIGGICGAPLATMIADRIGTARGLLVCALCSAPFGLFIPLTGPGPLLVLFVIGGAVESAGLVATNVIVRSFRQSYCPIQLLGRITASGRTISRSVIPLGALFAGGLGTVLGPRGGLWIVTIVFVVSALVLLVGPIRARRDLPVEPTAGLIHRDPAAPG